MSVSDKEIEELFIEAVIEKLNNLYTITEDLDPNEEAINNFASLLFTDEEKEEEEKEKEENLKDSYYNTVSNEVFESLFSEEYKAKHKSRFKTSIARKFKKFLTCAIFVASPILAAAFGASHPETINNIKSQFGISAAKTVQDTIKGRQENTKTGKPGRVTTQKVKNPNTCSIEGVTRDGNATTTKLCLNIEKSLNMLDDAFFQTSDRQKEWDNFRILNPNKNIASVTATVKVVTDNNAKTQGSWSIHYKITAKNGGFFEMDSSYRIESSPELIMDLEKEVKDMSIGKVKTVSR